MDPHIGFDFASCGLFANQLGGVACEIYDDLTSKNEQRQCQNMHRLRGMKR